MITQPIPTLPGFFARDDGEILDSRGVVPSRPMTGKPYRIVDISIGGFRTTRYVHRLVCEAFHGEPKLGEQAHHKRDYANVPDNLEWVQCKVEHAKRDKVARASRKPATPGKPYDDFPLTPCGNGQWRKIVNKKPYYFGSWHSDKNGAEAIKAWVSRRDAIHAGLDQISTPKAATGGKTVKELVTWYLAIRTADVKAGRLAPESFRDYISCLDSFLGHVGPLAKASSLKPQHFTSYRAKLDERKLGPHAIKRTTANIKAMFNYAMAEGEIPTIQYGRRFVAPTLDDASLATHYERTGKTNKREVILTRGQIRQLLRSLKDNPFWKAIVFVMLNTAMNPAEIARLKWTEINLKSGRLSRRRWKKGIRQEAYLWKATRAALALLPRSGEWVFPRPNGKQLVHARTEVVGDMLAVHRSNRVSRPFRDLAEAAGLKGVTPYTLRRTARTWAAHCHDDNAAKRMMGQTLSGQDSTYVKGKFPLARLKNVALTMLSRLTRKPQVKNGQMRIAG